MAKTFLYKIKIICFLFLIISLCFCKGVKPAQIPVITKIKEYNKIVKQDSLQKMISLSTIIPNLVVDLRYATTHNFTYKKLYSTNAVACLRLPASYGLKKVQDELKSSGLGLKIFDAYRPYRVTEKMWHLIHDERYVANPAKGSGHNRGLAVDLTLIDLKTGNELNMGTAFDNFTDSAHHAFKQLPTVVLENRLLLKQIMKKAGFNALETEWWHYSWPNDRNYQVLDIDFKKLNKLF